MTRGERIRYLRENRIPRKWSQEELGKHAGGIPFNLICKYERDEVNIPSENLKAIAIALNCSIDYLEGLAGSPNTTIKGVQIMAVDMKDTVDISEMSPHDQDMIRKYQCSLFYI